MFQYSLLSIEHANISGVFALPVYASRARAKTDYLSIAILALYVVIALSHAIYTVALGRSSRSWEKLEDFIALLVNSRPAPDALGNTCAGVERIRTKGLNSRTVVLGGNGDRKAEQGEEKEAGSGTQEYNGCWPEEEEVQLVFEDE